MWELHLEIMMIFTYLIPKVYFLCQDSVFVCFDTGRWYLYTEIMFKIKKRIYIVPRHFWAPNGTRLSARCHFTGPKQVSISRAQPPPTCHCYGCCPHRNHYARGRINHRCIKIAIMIMGIPIGSPFGGGLPFLYDQRSISSLPFWGYWMIYSLSRGRMIWLHPRPLPPRSSVSSTSDTQKDW